ncbi:MAG: hypothetical protein R3C05_08420 [Pirellulaceae bacterium]
MDNPERRTINKVGEGIKIYPMTGSRWTVLELILPLTRYANRVA